MKKPESREHLADWLTEELVYADAKFADYPDGTLDSDVEWILNYGVRAKLFGLDTPQGRQALGKLTAACLRVTENAIRSHGPMPRPGVPSGEIEDWRIEDAGSGGVW